MKRISILLAVLIGFGTAAFSQADPDTSKVRIGKKQYTIIVDDDKEVRIITEGDDVVVKERVHKKKKKRMNGMWSGFEIGANYFVDNDFNLELPADGEFMDLRVPNSYTLNFNGPEKSFGLIDNYFGLVTGIGFEYTRYMLENDVSIVELDGMMTGIPVNHDLNKNRLSMGYLTVPLMAEIQLPVTGERSRIQLSAGVIGAMRICSKQVQKYTVDGSKHKNKAKDNLNLRSFRYGFTARVGYRDFGFFANYYPQTLFQSDVSPDIFPVTVGLHFGG